MGGPCGYRGFCKTGLKCCHSVYYLGGDTFPRVRGTGRRSLAHAALAGVGWDVHCFRPPSPLAPLAQLPTCQAANGCPAKPCHRRNGGHCWNFVF